MKKRFFTLVELLIVISVIAILAGLLLPAIGKVKDKAKKVKAKAEANTLVLAIKSYESTYGLLPWTNTNDVCTDGDGTPTTTVAFTPDDYDNLMEVLTCVDGPDSGNSTVVGTTGNARGIRFLDASSEYTKPDTSDADIKYGYRDPWGNRFGIALDTNYDNTVTLPTAPASGIPDYDTAAKRILQGTVFVWSYGPAPSGSNVSVNKFGSYTSPNTNVPSWKE